MSTILVQFAERQWTMRAMHLACAMARSSDAQVLLLVLSRVPSPFLLGAEIAMMRPTPRELAALHDCAHIANEYGVALRVEPMQYDTIGGAIAQAVVEYEAVAAFVQMPHSRMPFADRLERWSIQRQLRACGFRLSLIAESAQDVAWVPTMKMKNAH
jgi:hypothetical protein